MKNKQHILTILFLIISSYVFSQTNFSNGFSDGYKKGYCQNQGIGCLAPIPPIAPIPNVNENMNSYQDGYNRGFEAGLNAEKKSNTNSETRQRYQTSSSKFTAQSVDLFDNHIYNPNVNSNILDLKMKALSTIIERAKENLENEDYDAAIDNSNDLLNIQPNLAIAYIIKSNAQFHKGEILNAYNNSAKANKIFSNSSSKNWYDFMYDKMSEHLSKNIENSYFSDVKYICENFWYKNDLSNYYLGLSNYHQGDLKAAKKYFKKTKNNSLAEIYLETINSTNKSSSKNAILTTPKKVTPTTPKTTEIYSGKYQYQTSFNNLPFKIILTEKANVNSNEIYICPSNSNVFVIEIFDDIFSKVYVDGYIGYLPTKVLKRQK
ncbi:MULTISPECIES: hypothetical protein [Flavobacterium]|uniref:SH3 domain-containing protein n=1 Tax=Flavobacterium hankyongi TaxID=1176532 RepID=A0ABP9A7Q8_9FLAO|nr:hypothetical protein [Flavobacterium sp. N1846]